MIKAAAAQVPMLLEVVDSIGLLPMRAADRPYTTAHSYRIFLQKNLNQLSAGQ
jgi:deoxyribodipyrimidine photo-lyase